MSQPNPVTFRDTRKGCVTSRHAVGRNNVTESHVTSQRHGAVPVESRAAKRDTDGDPKAHFCELTIRTGQFANAKLAASER